MATKLCKTAWVRYQHKFGLFLWTKHFAGTSKSSQGTTAMTFKIDHGHFDHCNFHIYSISRTPNQLKRFLDPGHTCIERSLVSSSTKYFSKAFRRFRTWELRTCDTWKLLSPLSSVMFSYQFTCKNSISNNHIYIKYFQKKSVFNYPTLHHSQEETYHGIWTSINSVQSGTDSCSVPRWFCTLRWCMAKRAWEATMPGFYAGEPIQNDLDYLDSMKKVEGKTSKKYQKKKLFSTRRKGGITTAIYCIYRMVLLLAVRNWILTSRFSGPCSY